MKSLIYGVGVNDADYVTNPYKDGEQGKCKFYRTWCAMLERCYSEKKHVKRPTYVGCSVDSLWHRFSSFRSWMEKQDWQGNDLDKDLLFKGNKVYSPETCVFISPQINKFINENKNIRGDYPLGVSWKKANNKFQAQCGNPITGKYEYLGLFDCPNKAHKAWLNKKRELSALLAFTQSDARIINALLTRY